MPDRRQFLAASAALAVSRAGAIEPVVRPAGPPKFTLGLAAYSFRQKLDLKKPSMSLFDFIDLAATLPLDAVELTSYYFAEESDAYLDKLKERAAAKKLTISGVPVRNDFCQKDPGKVKADVEHVKAWLGRAARLGAASIRVFAGNVPKGDTLEAAQKRVIAALEECCETAKTLGVKLALENHHGVTSTPEQLLALVQPINSPALGVNIDTGNFHTADPYADTAKIAPYGVNVQVKTEVMPGGKKEPADLKRVVELLRAANYHGPVVLEYEAAEDAGVAVPRHVKELRALIGG